MGSTCEGGSRRPRSNSPNEGISATWRSGLTVCHAVPHHDDCLEPVGLQMGQKWEQTGPVRSRTSTGQRQMNAAWGRTGIAIDHSPCAPAGLSSAHRLDVLHRVPLAAAAAGELCGIKPGVAAILLQAGRQAGGRAGRQAGRQQAGRRRRGCATDTPFDCCAAFDSSSSSRPVGKQQVCGSAWPQLRHPR